jgi:hypothetical protein
MGRMAILPESNNPITTNTVAVISNKVIESLLINDEELQHAALFHIHKTLILIKYVRTGYLFSANGTTIS